MHVAERVGCEVMRPSDDEIGAQRRHLLSARHIGRAEDRQSGIGIPVSGRLFPIRRNRPHDAVCDAEIDHQLRRARIGDEHALRHMRERERHRMSLAVRRDERLAARRSLPFLRPAPLRIGEKKHERGDGEERQQTERRTQPPHDAYAPVR